MQTGIHFVFEALKYQYQINLNEAIMKPASINTNFMSPANMNSNFDQKKNFY